MCGDSLDVSKKPAVRGLVFCDSVSVGVIGSRSGCFGAFVSSRKITFPGNRDFGSQRLGSNARLLSEKAKHQVLLRPFCGQVGEVRQPIPCGSRLSMAALTRSGARSQTQPSFATHSFASNRRKAGDEPPPFGRCQGWRSELAFKAAMICARSFASLTPSNVLLVPGRNLLGDSKNLSRSASLQTPPAVFSASE